MNDPKEVPLGPDLVPGDVAATLPAAVRHLLPRVSLRRSADDGMHGNDAHYLSVGASALNVITAALQLSGAPTPGSVLDFGSGAGRVTRWLRAAYPEAALSACDLRPGDVDFCRGTLGARGWVSGTDVEALQFQGTYDLVWVGSVVTHLPEAVSVRLVERLLSVLNPAGHLAFSTIGRHARSVQERDGQFIHPEGWATVRDGYDATGYGYADYDDQAVYGLSLSRATWAADLATRRPGTRLALLAETAWDGLHDVVVLQRSDGQAADPPLPDPAHALADRVARLEASTSWRITAPLRHVVDLVRGRA